MSAGLWICLFQPVYSLNHAAKRGFSLQLAKSPVCFQKSEPDNNQNRKWLDNIEETEKGNNMM